MFRALNYQRSSLYRVMEGRDNRRKTGKLSFHTYFPGTLPRHFEKSLYHIINISLFLPSLHINIYMINLIYKMGGEKMLMFQEAGVVLRQRRERGGGGGSASATSMPEEEGAVGLCQTYWRQ